MKQRRAASAPGGWVWRFVGVGLGGGAVALAVLSLPVHGQAQAPNAPVVQPMPQREQPAAQMVPAVAAPPDAATLEGAPAEGAPADWRRSLTKALTYQTIVVSTDQLLYWAIVTGTTATELEFFAANAVTGVGYFVTFDQVWAAAGLDPAPGESQVSVSKAIAYRVFDTARAFAVTLAVGTPFVASLEVTAAIAATRTVIYMLHDYAWSWASPPSVAMAGREPPPELSPPARP